MIVALSLCSRIKAIAASNFSWVILPVLLRIMVPACSIWLQKNSPKFLIYILHLVASTTATAELISTSTSLATPSTALTTSDNLPTPEGSMITRSGS